MNVHNIQASCFITWWINSICQVQQSIPYWQMDHAMTLDLCRMLFFFTVQTLRHQHCLALVHRTCDKLHFVQTWRFWRRSNQPWGLLFQYQVSLWPYEIIRPKTSLGSTSMWPRWDTGKSNPKNFLFHWSVQNILEGSPDPPAVSWSHFFPHVSEDSTDDHRMQGLMLKIVEGWRNPSHGTMNWIEFYQTWIQFMAQTWIAWWKMSRDGHKPESDCINWHWDSCNSSLRPFPANGWGLWSCQHITEHQFLETTTVN